MKKKTLKRMLEEMQNTLCDILYQQKASCDMPMTARQFAGYKGSGDISEKLDILAMEKYGFNYGLSPYSGELPVSMWEELYYWKGNK